MYYVYMIRCQDNSLYTGITTDIERRFNEHLTKDKKCAKYTQSHDVLKIESVWTTDSKKSASKLEYHIKRLSKDNKELLIKNQKSLLELFNDKINVEDYEWKESEKTQ